MRTRIFMLILIIVSTSIATSTHAQKAEKVLPEYWMNIRSAPLRIGPVAYEEYGYTLGNYTNIGPVIRYKFGCAIRDGKKTVVLSERQEKEGYFPAQLPGLPGHIITEPTMMMVTGSHAFPEPLCEKGKLAVIEVTFEDGGVWRASR